MMSQRATSPSYERSVRSIPYDLIRELAIAMALSLVLILALAIFLSSPNVASSTIQSWAKADPVDFVTAANNELAGTSLSANYGPPYNNGTGSVQSIGPISPQTWGGVHIIIDQPNDYVITPLRQAASSDASLADAINTWQAASADQQAKWHDAFDKALANAKVDNGQVTVPDGDYGPVQQMLTRLLQLGQAGALDGLLLASDRFYQTDYTKPLIFMGDGTHLAGLAQDQHLTGSQWGMMNETGLYPGQTWLWLYTLWYQLPPFNTAWASFTDLAVVAMMALLSLLLLLVPFIPGLRDIPRWIPIYRLVWRNYYAETPSIDKA